MRQTLLTGTLLCLLAWTVQAQEVDEEDNLPAALRGKTLTVLIAARILSEGDVAVWEANADKHTIPGRAVTIKMVGTNLVILASFTPYLMTGSDEHMLVAQGEIWAKADSGNVRYHSSVQTIPMKFGELVYFFPLGNAPENSGSDRIEVTIEVIPDVEKTE